MREQALTVSAQSFPLTRSTAVDLQPVARGKIADVMIDSFVLAHRSLLRVPRQMDWLVGVTIMPVMFLLLFRYIFGGTVQATMPVGESAVNYLVVGIVLQGIVFGSLNTALGLATDAKEGLMDRFRSLPMSRVSVLLGRILADMVLAIFVTTITFVVGSLAGFRPGGNIIDWLAAIGLMVLLAFTLSWVGATIGLWLKTIEAVNSIGFALVMPLTFVSSAFTRPDFMPGWLQGFARNQPFTLTVDTVRGLLTGYPEIGNRGWIAVTWMIGTLIIMVPLSVWLFDRRAKA